VPEKSFAEITNELREDMWMPRQTYWCGCNHAYICPEHAARRAMDHYHPETIK
jgi:hypothetical protein